MLPCDDITDHYSQYIIDNIRKTPYNIRYIRDERNFILADYTTSFSQLPLNIIYAVEDTEEKLEPFNKFITECIENHKAR